MRLVSALEQTAGSLSSPACWGLPPISFQSTDLGVDEEAAFSGLSRKDRAMSRSCSRALLGSLPHWKNQRAKEMFAGPA